MILELPRRISAKTQLVESMLRSYSLDGLADDLVEPELQFDAGVPLL